MLYKFFNQDISKLSYIMYLLIFLFSFTSTQIAFAQTDHDTEILEWRKDRLEKLTAPVSWTSLSGLHWLENGAYSIGSGATNDIFLSGENIPENAFMLGMRNKEFKVFETDHQMLKSENGNVIGNGENLSLNTKYVIDQYVLALIERGDKAALRIWDTQSPARFKYKELPYYPIDKKWVIKGKVTPQSDMTIKVKNILGMEIDQNVAATVEAKIGKNKYNFLVFEDDSRYYMVFADDTNGNTTYGGGRYVYFAKEDNKGNVYIDFNKAYTPPCGFSKFSTCYLPLPQNHIEGEVNVGELFIDEDSVNQ